MADRLGLPASVANRIAPPAAVSQLREGAAVNAPDQLVIAKLDSLAPYGRKVCFEPDKSSTINRIRKRQPEKPG